MAVILLIRHAEADYQPGRLYGWTPGVGLSAKGREQAKLLAERLEAVRLAGLYSSPLERCLETAGAVASGRRVEVQVRDDLGEVKYGKWQGRTFRSLQRTKLWRTVQLLPSRARFPEGETVRALQHRGVNAIEEIAAAHRRGVVAVVSHADMIKVIAAHYLGMPLDMFQRIVIEVASVTAIALGEGFPRVLRLSEVGSFESFGRT